MMRMSSTNMKSKLQAIKSETRFRAKLTLQEIWSKRLRTRRKKCGIFYNMYAIAAVYKDYDCV